MLKVKGIFIRTKVTTRGVYVTTAQADKIVDEVVWEYGLTEELYKDGRRHIGTEFSKIYKALLFKELYADEMLYVEAAPKVLKAFNDQHIPYNIKPLTMSDDITSPKYIQLVSTKMLRIYLGKLRLSDKIIDTIFDKIRTVELVLSEKMCVEGNKPVDIQGKPLVQIINSRMANKEIAKNETIKHTDKGMSVKIPKASTMEYVKTGVLLRKDLYIAIKAISAMEERHMYQVIEDLILSKSSADLSLLETN